MAILDNEEILYSNPNKAIPIRFESLKENFSEDTAKVYSESYCNEKLSTILENSRYIFAEPFYGFGFYKNIVESALLPYDKYESELNKVNIFIEENGKDMSKKQLSNFEELSNILTEKVKNTENLNKLMHLALERNANDYITEICDMYYSYEKTNDADNYNMINESLYEDISDPYTFFSIGLPIYERTKDSYNLMKNLKKYYKKFSLNMSPADFKTLTESVIACNIIKDNKDTLESAFDNFNLRYKIDELFNESVSNFDNIIDNIKLEYTPMGILSSSDGVSALFEETENISYYNDELICERYDRLMLKKIMCEALIEESVNDLYFDGTNEATSTILERYMDKLEKINSEILTLEYSEDGSPNKVIANHTQLSKSKEQEKKDKEEQRKKQQKELEDSNDSDDDEDEDSKKDKSSDETKSDEEKSDDNNENEIPHKDKPKEDLATKIQNKALDIDAKNTEKRANRKEKRQKLKNAAKAITKGPKGVLDSVKNFVKKVDEMDDNRRKEFLLKPGFRKEIFHKFKIALIYGGAATASLAYVPVAMVARHYSKLKSTRMRNELARELETEINVCNEKISDASAKGDEKEKYRLMRIKDKLESDRLRVRVNSKYI